ncbi:MAG: hypothetical protein ABSC29_04350 [Minisyncoccia bacterium]|jgi:hypothetical protein
MKKLFIILLFVVAIASFGGILRSVPAHADETLSPAQTAVLQQSLDAMKAQLSELQSQAAAQAGASVLTSHVNGLSTEDVASLRSALSLLSSALISLQTSLAQNPQLIAGREGAVLTTLRGVGAVLATIGTTLGGENNVASVSVSAPIVQSQPAAGTSPYVPPLLSAGGRSAMGTPTQMTFASAVAETAQVGSTWSFKNLNWPLVIVIILVVVAVALWLFWPGGEDKGKPKEDIFLTSTPIRPTTPMVSPIVKEMPQQPQSQNQTQSQQQRRPA